MTVTQLHNHYVLYLESKNRCLDDVYTKCSSEKRKAFDECLDRMCEQNGYSGRIVTYNNHMFTFGYMTDGFNREYFHLITPTKKYTLRVM